MPPPATCPSGTRASTPILAWASTASIPDWGNPELTLISLAILLAYRRNTVNLHGNYKLQYYIGLPFVKDLATVGSPYFHWRPTADGRAMLNSSDGQSGHKGHPLPQRITQETDPFWHDGIYPPYDPASMAELKRTIDTCHRLGMKIIPYVSVRGSIPTRRIRRKNRPRGGRRSLRVSRTCTRGTAAANSQGQLQVLLTEEELTRNLQIVLRTFDDLNYRQEQRFHLELGLLKLIHAQRLLPIEELLSGVAGATGAAIGNRAHRAARQCHGCASCKRTLASAPPRESSGSRSGSQSAAPAPQQRQEMGTAAAVDSHGPRAQPPRASRRPSLPSPRRQPATLHLRRSLRARGPRRLEAKKATAGGLSAEHLREVIVAALARAGHTSAAQLLGSGAWTLDSSSVRVPCPD